MKKAISLFIFLCAALKAGAQVVTANFTCPDTVCVNQSFNITNLSVGASTYYWTFCQGNTNVTPLAANLGNLGGFNGPVFVTMAKDGANHYAFVTNNWNSTLTRLNFGSSLLNTPVGANLGNISGAFPGNLEDLHLEYESGNWYGIAVGGMFGSERVIRLNFGNSLANMPTAVNMGNIGGMSYPQRIKIFNSGGNLYGFVANRDNNTITRLNFGSSITNVPTGVNLGNIGMLNTPDALALITVAGSWYGYVINEGNNTLTRLDFGSSLLNTPIGTNLGNTGVLNGPRAIDVWNECNQIRGLITNRYSNDLLNMNFTAGPTGPIVTTSFGNIASFSFPHSIGRFRSGDTLYAFITNVSNHTMSRICYPGCTNASIPSSTLATPPPISYNAPGNYYINLLVNEGQITQTSYCKRVTVISPTVMAFNSGPVCSGATLTLSATGASSYTWNPGGLNGGTVVVTPTANTVYSVTGLSGICTATATTSVSVTTGISLSVNATQTALCIGNTVTITATGASSYTWNPGGSTLSAIVVSPTATTVYSVSSNNGSCNVIKTVSIQVSNTPVLNLTNSGAICAGNSATLTCTGAPTFTWMPGNLTGSVISVSPPSNASYTVLAGTGTCSNSAVSDVTVNPVPVLNVSNSATICSGNSLTLNATGATTYTWNPGASVGSINVVNPNSTTIYSITGDSNNCSSTATVLVTVNSSPSITATNTSSGCVGDIISLFSNSNPGVTYQWSGPNGYSSSVQNPTFTASSESVNGTYTVVASLNGCSSQGLTNISVSTFSLIQILSNDKTGCAAFCTSFSIAAGTSTLPVSWMFGDGNQGLGNNLTHCFTRSGSYTVGVMVNNPAGCSSTGSTVINVLPKPVADFNYSPIRPITGEEVKFTDASYDSIISWSWFFMSTSQFVSDQQNPVFVYPDEGVYAVALVVKNNFGCMDTLVKVLNVFEEAMLYIPNAFTPNNDGLNDLFTPKGVGITDYEMMIFDRWGEKIFESKKFEKGWDGTVQGKGKQLCPSDIYIYKIKYTTIFEEAFERVGHVSLIK
jgi:gliding motility-associated-like protein